jgi:hypothetical protein
MIGVARRKRRNARVIGGTSTRLILTRGKVTPHMKTIIARDAMVRAFMLACSAS